MSEQLDKYLDGLNDLIKQDDDKQYKKWYTAPEGVKCYDKYEDTMKPYGFPKGGGGEGYVSDEKARILRIQATHKGRI